MSYTDIDFPAEYFETKLYTGTGATQSITGLNFAPDLVWTKSRSNAGYNNQVHDVIRGADKVLWTNLTNAEGTADTDGFLSFQSDGFNLGADTVYTEVNVSGQTYASWNFKANGAGVSNTAGTITSTVSASTTSGFSIVSYTGTGANATVGHGLSSAPKMVIFKNRDDGTQEWDTYHIGLTNATYFIQLNSTNAQSNTNGTLRFNSTAPSSTVFSVGTSTTTNASGEDIIAYCFAEVKGFSKAGSWTGNGNADGTFIYTGFKPAMIFHKRTDSTGDWRIWDNKRSNFNLVNKILYPSASNGEGTETFGDFLSNGFKIRTSGTDYNASGGTYVYMAFAEHPFVTSTSIPTTAR